MKIEVLVTTMHQKDISKYKEMNLQTDAVIANQADKNEIIEETVDGKSVKMITTNTRGVSLNRNIAIIYSKFDIVVFADDDQKFVDGYEKIIIDEFEKHPEADAIKFYCESTNPERPMSFKKPPKFCRATNRNIMSAGVHGFAVKKEFLINNNVFFNTAIGPGKEIYCGEDSAFLNDLLKKKAAIYLSPTFISYINQGESSWFRGYDEQFFISCGYIYACIYGLLAPLAILRRAKNISKNKKCTFSIKKMVSLMINGMKKYHK